MPSYPASTTDKDLSNLTPPITSRSQAIAQNTIIQSRNTARQLRRDDPNHIELVEDDEALLDLDELLGDDAALGTPPRLPSPDLCLGGVAGIMNDLLKLTPRTKRGLVSLLASSVDKEPGDSATNTPRILLSSSEERPVESRTSTSFRIHSDLVALASARLHIPLSMFTSSATDRLWRDSAALRTKKISLTSGKFTVVDTSQFPNEDNIDAFQFHEAYQNLLEFRFR